MSNSAATATGTLAATPLSGLLIYALERKLDGSLVFEASSGGKSALTLSGGRVTNSRLASSHHRLGEVCQMLGLLDAERARAAAERAAGPLFGEVLLSLGLDASALEMALREQLLLHVESIAALPGDTVYGFYAGRDYLERWGAERPSVEPLAAIWRADRVAPIGPALETVKRLERVPLLRLHRHSRVGRFGFSAHETSMLDVLRARPLGYHDLSNLGLLPAEDLARVLHVLARTRHLDLGIDGLPLGVERVASIPSQRATVPAISEAPAVPSAPGTPNVEDSQRLEEIASLHQRLDTLDYYTLLNVPESADANAVQAAFFQLARKWHPDKLPPALSSELERVTRIFARISEAHRVLSNPALRLEYDRRNQEGTDTDEDQAKVQQVLRAATAFQKAEVAARRADWLQALKLAEQAHQDDPEQAEYLALFAFARVKGGAKDPADLEKSLAMLNAAVEQQPKNLRVKLYRAHVLKQAGKQAEAMRDFRAVVEAEPNNVEAQRELRLFKMRRDGAEEKEKPEQGGLLGRLFRKE